MDPVTRGRLKLILVLTLFLGPLLAAFLWYYSFGAALTPKGKTNYANLISPVVTLSDFNDHLTDSSAFKLDGLKRKWTIVHIVREACDEQCELSLYNTRQTRIAVGKDANRLQRVLILSTSVPAEPIMEQHADLKVIHMEDSGLGAELAAISADIKSGSNDALMIDPLGNVMMEIPVDLNPSLLLKDLKKLLKLSRVG